MVAHGNADVMSHFRLPESPQSTSLPPEMVLLIEELDASSVMADRIQTWTTTIPLLSHVHQFVQSG